MTKSSQEKASLRRIICQRRRKLSTKELFIAEQTVAHNAGNLPTLLKAKRVASYIPFNGEISPRAIEQQLSSTHFFYPNITNKRLCEMRFYSARNKLINGHFNIQQPKAIGSPINLMSLDAVLVPLVSFDRQGNRLGMGAGFYDRAFSFKLFSDKTNRPLLIGLAYDFQETDAIQAQPWDVPLDVILTDKSLIKIS